MSLETVLATYRKWPVASTVTERGSVPEAKGEPGTGLKTPVLESTVKTETSLAKRLGTKMNFPESATARGPLSVANGEPGIWANAPVLASTRNTETLLESRFATYTK